MASGGSGRRPTSRPGPTPYAVAIGDLNGDGQPDLAVTASGGNTLSVLLGDGAGGFGAKTDFSVGIGVEGIGRSAM